MLRSPGCFTVIYCSIFVRFMLQSPHMLLRDKGTHAFPRLKAEAKKGTEKGSDGVKKEEGGEESSACPASKQKKRAAPKRKTRK